MCNCNNNCNNNDFHRVLSVTVNTDNVVLSVTNSDNIGNMEAFNLICCKPISSLITADPLPVQIEVNGVATNVKNSYGLPLMSNVVPWGCTKGSFVIDTSGTADSTYVILKTPCYA